MEGEALEMFLSHFADGHCKCLKEGYESQPDSFKVSKKSWIHVATVIGNVELFYKIIEKFSCDINAETSICHFTPLSLAVMQTRS